MRSKIFLSAFCILVLNFAHAQNFQFINPPLVPVNTNPSFAGSNGGIRVQSVYNINPSWSSFGNYYDYGTATSVDGFVKRLNAGVALTYNGNGFSGIYNYNQAAFTYAQYFSLRNNTLKIIPSLQLSYSEKALNIWSDINPRRSTSLNGGLLVNYKKLYVGLSVDGAYHSEKIPNYYRTFTNVCFNASYNFMLTERHLLNVYLKSSSPHAGTITLLGVNAVLFKHLIIGAGSNVFHWGYNLNSSVGYRHNLFSVVFSYSNFPAYLSNSSYQLTASFNLRNKEQRKQLTHFEQW